jgi:hypothetical protein
MTFANKVARTALYTFAATVLFIAGLILDVQAFDRTSGGYEPPYTDYTGTPIDWTLADGTATGMAQRGRVMNILIDCSSGMITFEVFKVRIPYRELSPRALAIHQPREACLQRGFSPSF